MEWIQTHLLTAGASIAILAVLGMLIKRIPALLEGKAIAALEYMFEKGDAADDAWLLATIRWAEAKYGPGSGEVKAKAVVDKIVALLPLKYRVFLSGKAYARAVELFQSCFDRLEGAVKKEAEAHKAE